MPEPDGPGRGPMAGIKLEVPGLEQAVAQLGALNTQMGTLQATLQSLNATQYQLSSGMNRLLQSIGSTAQRTTQQLQQTGQAMQAVSQGGAPSSPTVGSSPPQRPGGWAGVKQVIGSSASGGVLRDIAMFPLRFMRSQIQENRDLALAAQGSLGMQTFASGIGQQRMMQVLAGFPGSVYGTPQDILDLFSISRQAGGFISPHAFGQLPPGMPGQVMAQQAPRTAGFLAGVRQMQYMNPGAPVGQIAATLGGFSANVGAQQQAAFLTGGAFAMIGRGGRQKTMAEWAEGVLRWLEDQRPGRDRGKGFTYGELLTQYFPGSNIDQWLAVNGVPPDMREYWWTYALGKTNKGGTTTGRALFGAGEALPETVQQNIAYQRLLSTTAQTRGGFNLAGQLTGAYANREVANTWFNDLMAQMINDVIPAALSNGALQFMQFLPDTIEDLLMTLLEKSGTAGTIIGGTLGYGPAITDIIRNASVGIGGSLSGILGGGDGGDVGDYGDWGPLGANSLAGLHPDMRKRVGAMMAVNPRLRITSGLRDRATQMKLRRAGNRNVTGLPSAHTRGMAADMGPRSQYAWLARNASRFGLKSGVNVGEPWHVGMGDVGDPPEEPDEGVGSGGGGGSSGSWGGGPELPEGGGILNIMESMFSGLLSPLLAVFGLTNPSQEDVIRGIGGFIPTVMALLTGIMGGGKEVNRQNLMFRPDLYSRLTRGMEQAGRGGGLGGQTPDKPWEPPPGWGGGNPPPSGTGPEPEVPDQGTLSWEDVVKVAHHAGFRGTALQTIVAIAGGESQRRPQAHNPNPPDDSYGLWQINMIGSMGPQRARQWGIDENRPYPELYDPNLNARAAWDLSGGGTNFRPWTVYTRGIYQQYMDEAKAAMQSTGLGDVEPMMMPPMPPAVTQQQAVPSMVFHNNFTIQGGNGNGIDARRTATLVADHLEDEMNRRMARRN